MAVHDQLLLPYRQRRTFPCRCSTRPDGRSRGFHRPVGAGRPGQAEARDGRSKVCYALTKAESRTPANLKDVEGLLFVSSRPAEGVRNEISFVMNFDLKEGVEHQAIIGNERFALVAKGQNMWLKNPAEEGRMLDSMRRGSGLEIKGTSKRGNATSDKYSLAGISQIVKRAEDTCK